MEITLENKKKAIANSLINALKKKNKVEEGGASGSKVKREHESTNLSAQKIMRGIVEPFTVPTVVKCHQWYKQLDKLRQYHK
jgi:hypothetical protein